MSRQTRIAGRQIEQSSSVCGVGEIRYSYDKNDARSSSCLFAQKNPPMIETQEHFNWRYRNTASESSSKVGGGITMMIIAGVLLLILIISHRMLIFGGMYWEEFKKDMFDKIATSFALLISAGLGIGGWFVFKAGKDEIAINDAEAEKIKNMPEPQPVMEPTTMNMDNIV